MMSLSLRGNADGRDKAWADIGIDMDDAAVLHEVSIHLRSR